MDGLKGFTILLLFQLAGEGIVRLLGLPLPAPVLGMVLLLPALLQLLQLLLIIWLTKKVAKLLVENLHGCTASAIGPAASMFNQSAQSG